MGLLEGKAVIVTGSGRGIGAEIAKLAAAQGAAVLVTDVDPAPAEQVAADIRAAGGKARAHAADISSWGAALSVTECCMDSYGRLDGLVNNAGLFRMGRVEEMTEADARLLMDVNVLGTAFCAHHAVKRMLAQGSGAILNVTSGAHMGIPMMGLYGATKGAVASFTYTWAAELKAQGIRVNALSPMGRTRMREVTTRYLSEHGLPTMGNEISASVNAPVAVYLLSDAAREVTGQIVRIEGRQLSLVCHPGVLLPVLERERWSIDDVIEAFREQLGARQLPTGVVGLELKSARAGSAFWEKQK